MRYPGTRREKREGGQPPGFDISGHGVANAAQLAEKSSLCDWTHFPVLPFTRRFGDMAVIIVQKAGRPD
jgi:hypothetical protein